MKARNHSDPYRGVPYTRNVGIKAKRMSGTPLRLAACPECKAEIGAACVSRGGKELTGAHVARRRLSLRAAREAQP